MIRLARTLLVSLAVLMSGACSKSPSALGPLCTLEARPGIQIEVRDSVTNAPAATGAQGIARSSSGQEEQLGDPTPLELVGLSERPGTYDILISKPGYQVWRRTGVVISRDACHVITVKLSARLMPIG